MDLTAFELHPDEGYNVIKAMLLYNGGPELYKQAWSDQPPLYPMLLAGLFRLFGTSVQVARNATTGLSIVLLASLAVCIRQSSSRINTAFCLILLVSSSLFFKFSLCATITIPALGLATAACAAWLVSFRKSSMGLAIAGGVLFGLALQTKLTVITLLPAFMVCFWQYKRQEPISAKNNKWKLLGAWFAGSSMTFFAVVLWFGWNSEALVSTHLGSATREAFKDRPGYFGVYTALAHDLDLAMLGTAGLICALRRPRWETSIPLVWFTTEVFVRSWHRPFWDYHYVHLAIPLVWLSAVAIDSFFCFLAIVKWSDLTMPPFKGAAILTAFSVILSCVIVKAPLRLSKESETIGRMFSMSDGQEWEIVSIMRANAKGEHWIFTDAPLFAFYTNIPVPPEIAVLSRKRLATGTTTQAELLNILAHYQPRLVVLSPGAFGKNIRPFLEARYTMAYDGGRFQLFIRVEDKR